MSLENRRKWTMTASIICFLANLLCDQLFIVTFPMGTFGLGLATSISEWVFLIVLAVYYILGKSEWKFSLKGCDWHDAPQIVKLGYSGALSRFVEMFRCLIVRRGAGGTHRYQRHRNRGSRLCSPADRRILQAAGH